MTAFKRRPRPRCWNARKDDLDREQWRSRTAHASNGSTSESKVPVSLDLDGTGQSTISTGVGFYDHMLTALAKHSLIDLEVTSVGDRQIDAHHTVEDTAIVLGQALRHRARRQGGIRRFGDALVPLDEALAQAVVDVSGRPYCVHTGEPAGQQYVLIGGGRPQTRQRALHRLADPARAGDAGLPRPPVPARHPAGRTGPAPHRGGPVQGGGPGAARRRGARSAGGGGAEHQGRPVCDPTEWWCWTTARATSARPNGRWPGPAPRSR